MQAHLSIQLHCTGETFQVQGSGVACMKPPFMVMALQGSGLVFMAPDKLDLQ